jgi:hypothetical protein
MVSFQALYFFPFEQACRKIRLKLMDDFELALV